MSALKEAYQRANVKAHNPDSTAPIAPPPAARKAKPSDMEQLLAIGLRLCEAMEAQTEAISALADSNRAMVDEISGQGMAEEDDGAGYDLAGNPIKAS